MSRPRIQIVVGERAVPQSVDDALRTVDAAASFTSIENALRYGLDPAVDARIVLTSPSGDLREAQELDDLLQAAAGASTATLLVHPTHGDTTTCGASGMTVAVVGEQSHAALVERLTVMLDQTRAARIAATRS